METLLTPTATPAALPKAPQHPRAKKGLRRVDWSDTYHTEESVRSLAALAGITLHEVANSDEGKGYYDTDKVVWYQAAVRLEDKRGRRRILINDLKRGSKWTGKRRRPLWELVYEVVRTAFFRANRDESHACCKCGAEHYHAGLKFYVLPMFTHYANGICFECNGFGYYTPALYAPSVLVIQSRSRNTKEEARRVEARKKQPAPTIQEGKQS